MYSFLLYNYKFLRNFTFNTINKICNKNLILVYNKTKYVTSHEGIIQGLIKESGI